MSPKKKLFEADDFDKKKKLFTSSDFDKESKETIFVEHSKDGKNGDSEVSHENFKFKNWIWIILALVACVIGYFIFSKFGDTTVSEHAQETERVGKTIVPNDSVAEQEATEEVISADEKEVSNNANSQDIKVNEAPATTNNSSNIATTKTSTVNDNISNDVEAEAMKVIRGDYGIGQERKDKLGSKYQTIQSRVNELKHEGVF